MASSSCENREAGVKIEAGRGTVDAYGNGRPMINGWAGGGRRQSSPFSFGQGGVEWKREN